MSLSLLPSLSEPPPPPPPPTAAGGRLLERPCGAAAATDFSHARRRKLEQRYLRARGAYTYAHDCVRSQLSLCFTPAADPSVSASAAAEDIGSGPGAGSLVGRARCRLRRPPSSLSFTAAAFSAPAATTAAAAAAAAEAEAVPPPPPPPLPPRPGTAGGAAAQRIAALAGRELALSSDGRLTSGDVSLDRVLASAPPLLVGRGVGGDEEGERGGSGARLRGARQQRPVTCPPQRKTQRRQRAAEWALRTLGGGSGGGGGSSGAGAVVVDLSGRVVQPEEMYRAACACAAPEVTGVDLRGSRVTKRTFDVLLDAVSRCPNVTEVLAQAAAPPPPDGGDADGGVVVDAGRRAHDRRRRELAARVRGNREGGGRLRVRRATRAAAQATARHGRVRADLVSVVASAEACAREELQAEWAAGLRAADVRCARGGAALGRRVAAAAQRAARERLGRLLAAVEAAHRADIDDAWSAGWLAVAARAEARVRAAVAADQAARRDVLRAAAAAARAAAGRAARARLAEEAAGRGREEAEEAVARAAHETAEGRKRATVAEKEGRCRKVARARTAARADLVREEGDRYNRGQVVTEETEGRAWICKRWEHCARLRQQERDRQRVTMQAHEGVRRDGISGAEEKELALLAAFAAASAGHLALQPVAAAAAARTAEHLRAAPVVTLAADAAGANPGLAPDADAEGAATAAAALATAPAYLTEQHRCVPGSAPPALRVGCRSVSVALPPAWLDGLRALATAERRLRREQAEVARRLAHACAELLAACDAAAAAAAAAAARAGAAEAKEAAAAAATAARAAEATGASAAEAASRKLAVVGGSVRFSLRREEGGDAGEGGDAEECLRLCEEEEGASSGEDGDGQQEGGGGGGREVVVTVGAGAGHAELAAAVRGCTYATRRVLKPGERSGGALVRHIDVSLHLRFGDGAEASAAAASPVLLAPPLLRLREGSAVPVFTEGDAADSTRLFAGLEVAAAPPPATLGGGVVRVSRVSGFADDDVVVFRNGPLVSLDTADGSVFCRGVRVATCEGASGTLQQQQGDVVVRLMDVAGGLSAEAVRCVLDRLMYFNASLDPVEGPRVLLATLTTGAAAAAVCVARLRLEVRVAAVDNPASVTVPRAKKFLHAPCAAATVAPNLRRHVRTAEFRPFFDAHVEDVDTEWFRGGFLTVTVAGVPQRGDCVGLPEACFADDGGGGGSGGGGWRGLLAVPAAAEDEEVALHGREVGHEHLYVVTCDGERTGVVGFYEAEGAGGVGVSTGGGGVGGGGGGGEPLEGRAGRRLLLTFALTGTASIVAAERVLRAVTFAAGPRASAEPRRVEAALQVGVTVGKVDTLGASTAGASAPASPCGVLCSGPSVELSSSHMPPGLQPPVRAAVSVRATASLFAAATAASKAVLRYTEGSPPVKLSAFEPAGDAVHEGFEGGFLRARVVEGWDAEDVLGLREEGFALRPRTVLHDVTFAQALREADRLEEERVGGGGATVPARVSEDASASDASRVLSAVAVSEVHADVRLLGFVVAAPAALQVSFPRGRVGGGGPPPVGRWEVGRLLRALTYANSDKDPQTLNKVVGVELSDGSCVACRQAVDILIQPIDDVTEIRLRSERVGYRPYDEEADVPTLLAPLGEACLRDPDTSHFDGGTLKVEITAGAARGDCLSLLTRQQQEAQIARVAAAPADPSLAEFALEKPGRFLFEVKEGSGPRERLLAAVDGSFAATVTQPPARGCRDARDLHVALAPLADGAAPRASLEAVSYVLQCVAFGVRVAGLQPPDRLREGPRTVAVTLSDPCNPQCGKAKLTVDVRPPFLHLPTRVPVSCTVGEPAAVAPRMVVHHSDALGFVAAGYVDVEVVEGCADGDVLWPNLRDSGCVLREGSVCCKAGCMAALSQRHKGHLRLAFSGATKATGKTLQGLLRTVALKAAAPGARTVRFAGTYDRPDRLSTEHVSVVTRVKQ